MKALWFGCLLFLVACCRGQVPESNEADVASQCDSLLQAWRSPNAKHDAQTRDALIESAVRGERPEIVEEVTAGGPVATKEIKAAMPSTAILLTVVKEFGELPARPFQSEENDYVFRRMTKTRFEAWTPDHGWLFDAKGNLIHEATPPRRDGLGRQWHGAFLPDGRWVTTDLWEHDCTLTFFSRKGKWFKEMASGILAPPKKSSDGNSRDLIGWARCDRDGKGWVVSIGSEGGRARIFVTPNGKPRVLDDSDTPQGDPSKPWNQPWKLCYPRDLEPKGYYIALYAPSDDFQTQISLNVPGHGMWSGYPTYMWGSGSAVIHMGSSRFGFLPQSHSVYISTDLYDKKTNKTWFFEENAKCLGWIGAIYLADSADSKAIWVVNEQNEITVLGLDLKERERLHFEERGAILKPLKLVPDLRLGFFAVEKGVVLARW